MFYLVKMLVRMVVLIESFEDAMSALCNHLGPVIGAAVVPDRAWPAAAKEVDRRSLGSDNVFNMP